MPDNTNTGGSFALHNNSITWDTADFFWNSSVHLWNFVAKAIEGGGNWEEHDKDKKKRREVIRLLMWRKGIKVYDEKKEIQNIELHIDDIKLIAEELKKNVQIIY
tara:strand:+ start:463 stop:777 length:315 start_codon:yes stop_codon:yes gene_type:complete